MLKKILVVAALAGLTNIGFSNAANAAADGIYGNLQLGYGNSHYDSGAVSPATTSSVDKTGFAGRVAAGYQFNRNLAAELGFTQFSKSKFNNVTRNNVNSGTSSITNSAVDLVAKGILPLNNGFGVFGTLGGALLNGNTSGSFVNSQNRFWPTFGVGASYDITNNVPVTVSWQRIQKVGGSQLQSTDFYSVGLEYHFG